MQRKCQKPHFFTRGKYTENPKQADKLCLVRHRALITSEDKKRISNEIYEVKMQVWFCAINLRMLEKYEFKS